MTNALNGAYQFYACAPLTESVSEEWWSKLGEPCLWIGDIDRVHQSNRAYLPGGQGEPANLADSVYERILCVDMAVSPLRLAGGSDFCASAMLPGVFLRAAVGTWVGAVSWLALESVAEVVREFGRPPWPVPVEIQSVWGRGFGSQQCVALRPGLRGSVKKGK